MTKQQFIDKAKEYGYDDSAIVELLKGYDELKALDPNASYEDIVLIMQAKY